MKRVMAVLLCTLTIGSLKQAATQTVDQGGTCETAMMVEPMSSTNGDLTPNDSDFFLIQIPPGGTLTVSTLGTTDTFGELFQVVNGVSTSIASHGFGFNESNFLISETVVEGNYCVQVSGSEESTQGAYVLQVDGNFIPAGSCSAANVQVSVPSVDFGSVPIGNLAATPTITITNISADPASNLFMDASFLEDLDTSHFGIVNDTCAGQTLMPGAQCTLRGVFLPLSEGPKTATIMIPCNDLDSLPLEVPLNGIGVVPPPQ
jgi:hypothetical protein